MLIPIDYTKKPKKIKLALAKPNKLVIANLPEAMHISYDNLLGRVNELSFVLPYNIEKNHELVKNPHVDILRERYLIKLKWGNYTEWFIINQISDEMDDKDVKRVHAFSLPYELKDRLIRNYNVTSYTPSQVLNDALSDTIWSVGEISTEFQNKYRSFEVSEKSVLDFVFEIGETFGGIIEFDTENRLVHLKTKESFSTDKGFKISYGKYLKSLKRESDPDEMVTRLKVYGKDGLSINGVNPTGTDYIESFSFFMYPFQRDENRNVIQSSYYMSDELCHAILDYEELVESKRGVFESLLNQKKQLEETLTQKNNELTRLKTELAIIQDKLDLQKKDGDFTLHDFIFNGGTVIKDAVFDKTRKYACMYKVSDNNGIQIQLDIKGQQTKSIPQANTWFVHQKYANQLTGSIWLTGTGENIHVTIYFVEISDEDYEAQNNDEDILSKYNDDYKQAQINAKQAEVDDIKNQIANIDTQIQNLKNELSIENNFTPELIQERNQYIIERVWTDENHIDPKELYEDAIKKFEELKSPKMQFDIGIVNFFEILEEQRNWDKLSIGDTITIKYELFNVNIKAMVTEIHYNDGDLSLTITNVQNLNKEDKLLEMIYSSHSTSTSVDMSKYKWNNASNEVENINNILNNDWDAAQRRIIAGANESVEISRRGVIIKNPDFPDEMLIAQAGVLALSKDGGKTWRTAITPDGVVAERLVGKILAGQNLIIENTGKYIIDENGLTIDGGSLFITNGLPESQIDPNAVNKWNNAEQNAKDYTDEQINQVNQVADNLQNQIDAFSSDNKLTLSEAKTLEALLESFKKESVDLINIATGMSITTEKNNYNNAIMALENELNNKWLNQANYPLNITDTQRNNIKTLIGNVQNAKSILVNKIMQIRQQNAQQYADSLKQQTDSEITDLQNQIDNTNLYIDGAFKDGIIQASEAKAIEKYINALNTEKADIDNQYNAIYNNIYLQDAVKKSDLQTKKADYDSKHAALMNSINTAISDGRTTSAEKADVDAKFNQYKTSLANLSTSLQNAIDDIAKNKANEAKNAAINYTNSQLANYVTQTVYNQDIANLQNQIDGNITSWFYPHDPTLSNEPAINWTTDADKNNHLGDLFYNTTNGYSYRFAYENGQYKWILLKDSDIQKALADAAKAQDTADQKRRVFVVQPTPPYDVGDLWANGQSVYRCKTAKISGQSFSSADWELIGDVTSLNTANNTANVGNQPATTVATAVTNFNKRNDRKSTPPANPVVATDGTAIDHTINTDGSADISFEWSFNGSGDAYDIDGFIVYVYQSTNSSPYSFGTSASQEQVFYVTPDKRALILYGVPANKYYTFGVQSYRIVDQDINANGILKSSIVKSTATGENPYRPSSNVAFGGDITGTINGVNAATVVSNAMNAVQQGVTYNNVKIDSVNGLVATRSDNKTRVVLNATDGIKVQKSTNGTDWVDVFYVDADGDIKYAGHLEGATGTFTGTLSVLYSDPYFNNKTQIDNSIYNEGKHKSFDYTNYVLVRNGVLAVGQNRTSTGAELSRIDVRSDQILMYLGNYPTVYLYNDYGYLGVKNAITIKGNDNPSLYPSGYVPSSNADIKINKGLIRVYEPNGTPTLFINAQKLGLGTTTDVGFEVAATGSGNTTMKIGNFNFQSSGTTLTISGGNLNLEGDIVTEAFQNASLINGWSNYGNGYQIAQYMKDPFGFVHLRGSIKWGVNPSVAFILPVGYRPTNKLWFTVSAGIKKIANVEIRPNGEVYIDTQDVNYVSLDDIPPFKAEQ